MYKLSKMAAPAGLYAPGAAPHVAPEVAVWTAAAAAATAAAVAAAAAAADNPRRAPLPAAPPPAGALAAAARVTAEIAARRANAVATAAAAAAATAAAAAAVAAAGGAEPDMTEVDGLAATPRPVLAAARAEAGPFLYLELQGPAIQEHGPSGSEDTTTVQYDYGIFTVGGPNSTVVMFNRGQPITQAAYNAQTLVRNEPNAATPQRTVATHLVPQGVGRRNLLRFLTSDMIYPLDTTDPLYQVVAMLCGLHVNKSRTQNDVRRHIWVTGDGLIWMVRTHMVLSPVSYSALQECNARLSMCRAGLFNFALTHSGTTQMALAKCLQSCLMIASHISSASFKDMGIVDYNKKQYNYWERYLVNEYKGYSL